MDPTPSMTQAECDQKITAAQARQYELNTQKEKLEKELAEADEACASLRAEMGFQYDGTGAIVGFDSSCIEDDARLTIEAFDEGPESLAGRQERLRRILDESAAAVQRVRSSKPRAKTVLNTVRTSLDFAKYTNTTYTKKFEESLPEAAYLSTILERLSKDEVLVKAGGKKDKARTSSQQPSSTASSPASKKTKPGQD